MTTAISRRLAALEQAVADERKEPVHIELVARGDGEELPPREPWKPGDVITKIYLVSLKPNEARP